MNNIPTRHIPQQPEAAPDAHFVIHELSVLLNGADMLQALHRHDFFYLLVLNKAAGEHEIDFNTYTITDHSLFFMRPGQVHRLALQAQSTGYLIRFGSGFYTGRNAAWQQALRQVSSRNHYKPGAGQMKELLQLLNAIKRESTEQRAHYQEAIAALLYLILLGLQRQLPQAGHQEGLYRQEQLDTFRLLLEDNFHKEKQVAYYARRMHLSAYQLNAITKALLNKTCSEVINDHILLEAKRCLLGTSGQVKSIADHLGYEDVAYFIRFFKKHTGFAPGAYRDHFG